MKGNLQIARIFGIPITINYSWIAIFLLLTGALAFFYFPSVYPGLSRGTQIGMGVVASLLFFFSIVFHELSHSIVARHYGMQINAINLWIFGGVSELTEEPKAPAIEFWMSVAGPLSSFFLAVFFGVVGYLGGLISVPAIVGVCFYLAFINGFLGAFNLLPGFPLDGGRVLRSAVWYYTGDYKRATSVATTGGRVIAYLMIFAGIVGTFSGVVTGLWLVFLGWFLLQAANSSYQQMAIRAALEGVTVAEAMTKDPETVTASLPVVDLVEGYFKRYPWDSFPVVDESGFLAGLVNVGTVREVPEQRWSELRVRDVMIPLSEELIVRSDQNIYDILPKLESKPGGRLLVSDGQHLAGIITEEDVSHVLQNRLRDER